MSRGLDHVIHAVQDLDAAGEFYSRLGFSVGARNRHPWGTHNRVVQFPNFFLEILTVGEPEKLPASDSANRFATMNHNFLTHTGEGLSGLVLECGDPAADLAIFEAAGFGGVPLFHFSRKGKRADGGDTEVGFDLVFTNYAASPRALFFAMKQTSPENFWSPELQQHANGAVAISACALVAENPTDHHIFLECFAGVRNVHSSSLGLAIRTPRGMVLALDRRGFADTYGVEPPLDAGLRVGAVVFKVHDIGATRALFERNGVPAVNHRDKLVVSGRAAHGAVLVFEAS
jgi:catechol 2,3-dioxygenase-like lactoylglutathione lyase family enzyme